jgi:ribonuclease P protein component
VLRNRRRKGRERLA